MKHFPSLRHKNIPFTLSAEVLPTTSAFLFIFLILLFFLEAYKHSESEAWASWHCWSCSVAWRCGDMWNLLEKDLLPWRKLSDKAPSVTDSLCTHTNTPIPEWWVIYNYVAGICFWWTFGDSVGNPANACNLFKKTLSKLKAKTDKHLNISAHNLWSAFQ